MRIPPVIFDPLDSSGATVPDGQYVLDVVGGVAVGWVEIDLSSAAQQMVSVTNGVPTPVFDTDGSPVYTEVPS